MDKKKLLIAGLALVCLAILVTLMVNTPKTAPEDQPRVIQERLND